MAGWYLVYCSTTPGGASLAKALPANEIATQSHAAAGGRL